MKTPEARKLIGKRVEWDNPRSLLFPTKSGVLEEVVNRNCLVESNWYWLPDMHNLRPAKENKT